MEPNLGFLKPNRLIQYCPILEKRCSVGVKSRLSCINETLPSKQCTVAHLINTVSVCPASIRKQMKKLI